MTTRGPRTFWQHLALCLAATALTVAILCVAAAFEAAWQYASDGRASVSLTMSGLVFTPRDTDTPAIEERPTRLDLTDVGPDKEVTIEPDWETWKSTGRTHDWRYTEYQPTDTLFYTAVQSGMRYARSLCIFAHACSQPQQGFDGYQLIPTEARSEGYDNWVVRPYKNHLVGPGGGCGCANTDKLGNTVVCFLCLLQSSLFSLQYLVTLSILLLLLINGSLARQYRHSLVWWGTRHSYKDEGAGSRALWIAELFFSSDEIKFTLLEHARDARIELLDSRRSSLTVLSTMYAHMLTTAALLLVRRLLEPVLRQLS